MTITIIDRHPVLRVGLNLSLRNHFDTPQISESESIEAFTSLGLVQGPDLFILGMIGSQDISLGSILDLRAKYPSSRIITYLEHAEAPSILDFLKMGVNGFVSKCDELEELLECIPVVLNDRPYICRRFVESLRHKPASLEKEIPPPLVAKLSQRENEISALHVKETSSQN